MVAANLSQQEAPPGVIPDKPLLMLLSILALALAAPFSTPHKHNIRPILSNELKYVLLILGTGDTLVSLDASNTQV